MEGQGVSVSNNFLYEPLHVIEFPVCALVLTVVGFELKIKKLLNIIVAAELRTYLVVGKELF